MSRPPAGERLGLAPHQAYLFASVCVDLRLAQVVNIPNPVVSALLPLDCFEPPLSV